MTALDLFVSPLGRVEGDLDVRVTIDDGVVTSAWTEAAMFRGFEIILRGKDPQAGLVVCPRICGICGGSHLYKSAYALDTAWRTHVPQWAAEDERTAYLICPVDLRRVLPGFPPTYFGCAVAMASACIGRDRLVTASPSELARHVRDAVAGVDAARAWESLRTLDRLRRDEGLAAFERLHVVHPRAGLLVTNLSRLPVREIVFDAGPPVAFDILAPVERCAVVLPAEDGLDVRICLPLHLRDSPAGGNPEGSG